MSGPHRDRSSKASSAPTHTAQGADFMSQLLSRDEPVQLARREMLEEFERRYIERLLEKHDGDTARAAAAAGVTRRYIQALVVKRHR
jgi:DNA-binding NtrC family response regulator